MTERRQGDTVNGSDFLSAYILPILFVFLIPEFSSLGFLWIEKRLDHDFLVRVKGGLGRGTAYGPDPGEKAAFIALVREHPASSALQNDDPRFQAYRKLFDKNEETSFRSVYYGLRFSYALILASLFALIICVLPSFMAKKYLIINYFVTLFQWNVLRVFVFLHIIGQGVLIIWLSFAFAEVVLNASSFKLITVAAVVGGIPILVMLKTMVGSLPAPNRLNGLEVGFSRAPTLWHGIAEIAKELHTAAPKNLVLDLNPEFSVSDGPVIVQLKELKGRTVFLSLMLLRVMSRRQVEALVFHQFSFFSGGDTNYIKKIGPLLSQYEVYLDGLKKNLLVLPVYYLLRFFWQSYHHSLANFHRSRKFQADRLVAERFGAETLAVALVLSAAIDQYLSDLHQTIFKQNAPQFDLDLGSTFRKGFWAYLENCHGPDRLERSLWDGNSGFVVEILERLAALGIDHLPIFQKDFSETRAEDTWIGAITNVEELEARLWSQAHEKLRRKHNERLAYVYLPASAKEQEIVEKVFPPMVFENQAGRELTLTFESVKFPDRKNVLKMDEIKSLEFEVYKKVHYLRINMQPNGEKFERILIDNFHASRDDIAGEIQKYLQRHQEARQWQKVNKEPIDSLPSADDLAGADENVDPDR